MCTGQVSNPINFFKVVSIYKIVFKSTVPPTTNQTQALCLINLCNTHQVSQNYGGFGRRKRDDKASDDSDQQWWQSSLQYYKRTEFTIAEAIEY